MRRATILSLALFSLLSLAGAATAAETEQPAAAPQAATVTAPAAEAIAVATPAAAQAAEVEAGLCNLLEASRTNVLESVTAGYWCPPNRWYCQRNSQCAGFCGVGYDHFAVCSQGCCACAG